LADDFDFNFQFPPGKPVTDDAFPRVRLGELTNDWAWHGALRGTGYQGNPVQLANEILRSVVSQAPGEPEPVLILWNAGLPPGWGISVTRSEFFAEMKRLAEGTRLPPALLALQTAQDRLLVGYPEIHKFCARADLKPPYYWPAPTPPVSMPAHNTNVEAGPSSGPPPVPSASFPPPRPSVKSAAEVEPDEPELDPEALKKELVDLLNGHGQIKESEHLSRANEYVRGKKRFAPLVTRTGKLDQLVWREIFRAVNPVNKFKPGATK
jgi:hypothetical protein